LGKKNGVNGTRGKRGGKLRGGDRRVKGQAQVGGGLQRHHSEGGELMEDVNGCGRGEGERGSIRRKGTLQNSKIDDAGDRGGCGNGKKKT